MSKRKLLLINPVNRMHPFSQDVVYPPLALGLIAALTPDNWDIKIADENFDEFQYEPADLVGITAYTSTANHSYKLAQRYREEKIPVVMGGIHVSMLPDEALRFVDSVVIGEAESVWKKVIEDFEQNRLQQTYRGEYLDLKGLVWPRRDLFDPRYIMAAVQTSRGCPYDCEFCSVSVFNERRYRRRPIAEVLDEVESVPQKVINFIDDNLLGCSAQDRAQALELCHGLLQRGIKKDWSCCATLSVDRDDEFMHVARKSGCRVIMMGFEADNPEALESLNKHMNIRRGVKNYHKLYDEVVTRINRHGMAAFSNLIFGIDTDTEKSIRIRRNFLRFSKVDITSISLMMPMPGTKLFKRLQESGRLLFTNFPEDWDNYTFFSLSMQPKLMTPEQLRKAFQKTIRQVFAYPILGIKFLRTWWRTRDLVTALWAIVTNLQLRGAINEYRARISAARKAMEARGEKCNLPEI